MKDMRDAYFDVLCEFGRRNKDVIILANDMDVFSLQQLKKEHPNQFINAGVAEQNMINVAAGLAEAQKKVFVYGIASFVIFRCFEQIKFNICSMNLPVTIIGVGPGLSFSFDGPTHHGTHDIGVVRMLPEMQIYSPCDAFSAAQVCFENPSGPTYVRIEKGTLPTFYGGKDGFWKQIRSYSEEHAVVTMGYMTHKVVEIADLLTSFSVFDVCQLQPFPDQLIKILSKFKTLTCVEEHSTVGGLASVISQYIGEQSIPVKRIGLPHTQLLKYGSRSWFHEESGLAAELLACFPR